MAYLTDTFLHQSNALMETKKLRLHPGSMLFLRHLRMQKFDCGIFSMPLLLRRKGGAENPLRDLVSQKKHASTLDP